jgi:putative endonuclease
MRRIRASGGGGRDGQDRHTGIALSALSSPGSGTGPRPSVGGVSASSSSPTPDHRPAVGLAGERFARDHLERLGYTVLAARARTRWGEIDLIVHDGRFIVFCEVKARIARGTGSPWASLHERKRRQVRRLAAAWLADTRDRPTGRDVRFDAIGVLIDPSGGLVRLDHIEAAF